MASPRTNTLGLGLAMVLVASASSFAQIRNCGTMEHHQQLVSRDPSIAARQMQIENATAGFVAAGVGADAIRRIPVVVHVVWSTPEQNVSVAQIQAQLQVLYQDFRRANADAANTLPQFAGVAADSEFEFCLATVDPAGAPTTGITRTQTAVASFSGNDSVKFAAQGGKNAWPAGQYLNMWVCNLGSGLLGYAQFPGGPANTDGVVIYFRAFGTVGAVQAPFNRGRTTTHEVGHWLNLRHIWGDQQPSCGDDFVNDTPPANGPHYGCQTGVSSCSGLNMVQNYMDYSDDSCMNLFTSGQKSRMQALFAAGGVRESLLSSPAACGGTPPPPPPAGTWQLNQPASRLTINNVLATATTPAIVQVPAGTSTSVAFASDAAGRPWDTLLSLAPVVPNGGGAAATAGGQLINLSPSAPALWLNSGSGTPAALPFPGNFSTPATPQAAGTWSLQQFMVTPSVADGFAISQACQLTAGPSAPACTISLPAGPTGDDSTVTVTLTGTSCSVPMPFFGTAYTQFHVSSNGRITFQAPDAAYGPTASAALTGRPFAGFWTDLNPSAGGSIQVTRPTSSRFRTTFSGVRYYGENATVNFAIELDTASGAVILDGLAAINANPETQALDVGQNQFLGLSRGAGATLNGLSFFAPGFSGSAPNGTAMLFDFYDAAVNYGGLCPSLQTALNRITFVPSANGNYSWTAQ